LIGGYLESSNKIVDANNRLQYGKNDFLLITALFLLRIVLGSVYLIHNHSELIKPTTRVYQILTFLLIAIFLRLHKDNLTKYNFDRLTIIIIILFKTLLYLDIKTSSLEFIDYAAFISYIIIALWLLISLRSSFSNLRKTDSRTWTWVFVGALVGLAKFFQFIEKNYPSTDTGNLIWYSIIAFSHNLSNAAIDEEPFFRGILWGYFCDKNFRNWQIWLSQAFLFWLAHINFLFLGQFTFFWIELPIASLLLGLLVWKSRTLATTITTHAVANTVAYISTALART
jgi:membrane protease YdiL (CAAX protease family)